MDDVDTLPKYGIDNVQFGNFDKLTIMGFLTQIGPNIYSCLLFFEQ